MFTYQGKYTCAFMEKSDNISCLTQSYSESMLKTSSSMYACVLNRKCYTQTTSCGYLFVRVYLNTSFSEETKRMCVWPFLRQFPV